MQVLDRRKAMAITPLLRLGFRPFFLAGCVLALLAVPLWLLALGGGWTWQQAGGWLAWHRHELLFGFALAIVAGFLLSAVQTWTGRPGLQGAPLAVLAGLWLAARLAWLGDLPLALLAPLELAFPLGVAAVMARTLWAVRQKRNYPIVAVLLLLTAADALALYGLASGSEALQKQSVQTWAWLDLALLLGSALVALLYAFGPALQPQLWIGLLFLLLAAGHGVRLVRWYDKSLWRRPPPLFLPPP